MILIEEIESTMVASLQRTLWYVLSPAGNTRALSLKSILLNQLINLLVSSTHCDIHFYYTPLKVL